MKSVKSKKWIINNLHNIWSRKILGASSSHAVLYNKLLNMVDLIDNPDIPKDKKHQDLHAYHI